MKRFLCWLITLGASLVLTHHAKADGLVFTTIDVAGSTHTFGSGISNSGQIVGTSLDKGIAHGYLLREGSFTTLDVPGTKETWAIKANDVGDVVGLYHLEQGSPPIGTFHGYLLHDGIYTTVDAPGVTDHNAANDINNLGEIVGQYHDSNGNHSYLLSGGTFTVLEVSGSSEAIARGINDAGHIVGEYVDEVDHLSHGFLLKDGNQTTLDVPGAIFTLAYGINNSGQVVGVFWDGSKLFGFLWSEGVYSTLDVPGSERTEAWDINDAGVIVGTTYDGSAHGFVATPVPESSSLVLLLLGAGCYVVILRRVCA
jgi:probable HAF family extracellular repeat protein